MGAETVRPITLTIAMVMIATATSRSTRGAKMPAINSRIPRPPGTMPTVEAIAPAATRPTAWTAVGSAPNAASVNQIRAAPTPRAASSIAEPETSHCAIPGRQHCTGKRRAAESERRSRQDQRPAEPEDTNPDSGTGGVSGPGLPGDQITQSDGGCSGNG